MMREVRPARFGALICLFVLAAVADAQNARVVVANSSNGEILDVTFTPPGSTVLNTDQNTRVSLQSVLFREDGAAGIQLLAADSSAGQVLYYPNSAGVGQIVLDNNVDPTHPSYPNGLSQDAQQNLFGVTSSTGNSSAAVPKVWVLQRSKGCTNCLPGGYVGPLAYLDNLVEGMTDVGGIPTTLEADLLDESLVVTATSGALSAGDLLVLSSSPAMLLRYKAADVSAFLSDLAAGNVPAELQPDVIINPPGSISPAVFPTGAQPNGMDFTPQGELLISAGNGVILRYTTDGTQLPDFASGLGNGKFKLAVGFEDGQPRAFVADRNGGELLRFTIESDGTGTLDASVTDPSSPVGVATTTGSVVAVPTGTNVTVATSDLLTSTVETVTATGSVSVQEFVFADPREDEVSVAINEPLNRPLDLSEISNLLPAGYQIPAYVRAFGKDDELTGTPTFILLLVDSSTAVSGLVAQHGDEERVLGYDPDCNDPDPTLQPRLFWVPSPTEPAIPEGPVFINLSTGCGTSQGATRNWSLFLVGARDTRPLDQIVQAQIDGLGSTLLAATCIQKKTYNTLVREYNATLRDWGRGNVQKTIDDLNSFLATIVASPGSFGNCLDNESGDLRARATAAIFSLGKLP